MSFLPEPLRIPAFRHYWLARLTNTIAKMEAVDGPFAVRTSTARTVEAVLRERGISFYNDEQPGARLDLSKRSAA